MTMITIDVTQADIDAGIPAAPCACAVHLAAERVLLSPLFSVGSTFIFFSVPRKQVTLPLRVTGLIDQLDACEPVKPFTFELDVPGELIPAGVS